LPNVPQKRFDWINGFITAALNSVLQNSGIHPTTRLTFRGANSAYLRNVVHAASSLLSFPQLYLQPDQLDYLFHLESELWGRDCGAYLGFFEPSTQRSRFVLQTFLLPHAFILIERWFQAFLPPSTNLTQGRPSKRRALFGHANGLFTVHFKDCLASLGAPYSLLASTTKVKDIARNDPWQTLRTMDAPLNMQIFYRNVCACPDPSPIIESSLKNARRKLPDHIFPGQHHTRAQTRDLKSTWYDALWIYSESIRYHPLSLSQVSLNRPFYWNRSVRWCTSLLISGLLSLASKNDPYHRIRATWQNAQNRNRILWSVFRASRNRIF
jgi:hypothetical protein